MYVVFFALFYIYCVGGRTWTIGVIWGVNRWFRQ